MHRKHKYDIIVVLAALALSVSIYLGVTKALNISVPCGITNGCEVVLNSRYSQLFGMSLTAWGVVFNGTVLVFALMANHYRIFRRSLTLLLGAGALAALAFLGIQFFVLKQLCQYCLVTDLIAIFMFLWDINIEFLKPYSQEQIA
jgi:uncharacterized membrane protein